MKPSKVKPAVLGGVVAGLLSAILGIIPFVNYCCCLWSLLGGVLAVHLYNKSLNKEGVPMADGAICGA
ncbi:MAG TPA: hypothetical protein PLD50_19150, partial [Polyangiaceae bacterium]|nr:hypothetical protein [Polyangiaceae bacterium]